MFFVPFLCLESRPSLVGWIDPWALSCSNDAKELAESLGNRPSADDRAHHTVISNSQDARIMILRGQVNDFGILINSAKNGT